METEKHIAKIIMGDNYSYLEWGPCRVDFACHHGELPRDRVAALRDAFLAAGGPLDEEGVMNVWKKTIPWNFWPGWDGEDGDEEDVWDDEDEDEDEDVRYDEDEDDPYGF